MYHKIDEDLKSICNQIIDANKTIEEWAEIESDDMFQVGNYEGGFDATEMMFCFSLYKDGKEYWFQIPLNGIGDIIKGKMGEIEIELTE